MGVYSNSRLAYNEGYVSNVEIPEPDMSYFGVAGANRILAEAAMNDLKMFEAIIGNDIQQAYVENAITEGADLTDELQSLQEAAAGGIFSRLKEFLKKIWQKITGLIMSFVTKIQGAVTSDNKKLVDKFKKKIMDKSSQLNKMKFKWSKVKVGDDFPLKQGITPDDVSAETEKEKNALFGKLAKLDDDEVNRDVPAIHGALKDLEKRLNDDDWEDKQLSKFVGSTTVADFTKDAHEYFFEDEEELDGDFGKYMTEIMATLVNAEKTTKDMKKNKDEVDKYFRKAISEVDKFSNRMLKFVGKKKDADMDAGATRVTAKGRKTAIDMGAVSDSDWNKDKMSNAAILSKAGATLQRYYNMYQGVVTKAINAQMAAVSFHIKQCRRVWVQAASFAAKSVKEDALLHIAVGEAADFETDQLIGYNA